MGDVSDPSSRLDLLILVVVSEGDDSFGSVLVGDRLRGGQVGGLLFILIVVGPIVPVLVVVSITSREETDFISSEREQAFFRHSLGLGRCRGGHDCGFLLDPC